jgi:hypothetical protein
MGGLSIRAFAEETMAGSGNRQPTFIVVSVTDAAGAPVGGLGAVNFKLDPIIPGPGAAPVDIDRVMQASLPGVYQIQIVPKVPERWKAGAYVLAITVEQAAEEGQTLATVLVA